MEEHHCTSSQVSTYFNLPLEVLVFICFVAHTMIVIVGYTFTEHAKDLNYLRDSTQMGDFVILVASLLVCLNALFTVITFFATIFAVSTPDQQKGSIVLTIYNASSWFLIIQICMMVPYMAYRAELTRKWQAEYRE